MKRGIDVYPQPVWLDVPIPEDLMPLFGKSLPGSGPFDLTINHWDPEHLEIETYAREMTRCAVAWCVDTDTEILTQRGWLRWDEVSAGDQALGINPVTGLSEWQEIRDIYRSGRACHEMVRLSCAGHESLTNPRHRWLIRSGMDLTWRRSEELQAGDQILRSVPCAQLPAEPKYADTFVELVAWTYTEGWLERGRSIRIGQNERVNPSKTQRIRAALLALCGPAQPNGKLTSCRLCGGTTPDSCGRITRARGLCHTCYMRESGRGSLGDWDRYKTWTESPRKPDGMVIFNLSRPVSQEILAACPGKSPSMDFLLSLTSAQLELFITISLQADGCGKTFSQTRGPRLDAFVTACVLAGKSVSRPHKTTHEHLATVTLSSRDASALTEKSFSRERYEGVIWCPSVEHGNWLARREGHIFYTGNTMWEFTRCPTPTAVMPDGREVKSAKSGLVPHCPRRGSLRKRLGLFDLVLGYDEVSLGALAPYIPPHVPGRVLQGGYESAEWEYASRDWDTETDFMFYMHGALGSRKCAWTAIQAFNELKFDKPEFAGAKLALHTNVPMGITPDMAQAVFGKQRIRVFMDAWSHRGLQEFYHQGHCFVCPSRGEGKNLPALESMTTGALAAVTNFGGHCQWLDESYAYPLDYTLGPTFPQRPDAAHDAKVSIETMKAAFWDIYSHREESRKKAELGAQVIPGKCDWNTVIQGLFESIRDNVGHNGKLVYEMAMDCA
jgi:hypothetical protein